MLRRRSASKGAEELRSYSIKGYWPMINGEKVTTVHGEKVTTVRFAQKEQWCEPVITLHHLSEKDLDDCGTGK